MPRDPSVSPLVTCTGCARHVRASEASCPFCDASLLRELEAPRLAPAPRLGRAALYAFGIGALSVTTAMTACNHEGDQSLGTVYGGPPAEFADSPDAGKTPKKAATPTPTPAPGQPH